VCERLRGNSSHGWCSGEQLLAAAGGACERWVTRPVRLRVGPAAAAADAASSDDRVSCGCGDKCGSIEQRTAQCQLREHQLSSQRQKGQARAPTGRQHCDVSTARAVNAPSSHRSDRMGLPASAANQASAEQQRAAAVGSEVTSQAPTASSDDGNTTAAAQRLACNSNRQRDVRTSSRNHM